MEPVYLKQSVNVDPSGVKADGDAPLSFLEWKQRRPGLVDSEAFSFYNQYVLGWFAGNKRTVLTNKFLIRQKYLYLLNQLQLFFTTDEKNEWYNKINLADEKELLLAVPYFAKKLKNISLYYLKLRKNIQHAKAKYNAVGSSVSIEREIYKLLLETFSSVNEELPVSLQQHVPNFSNLQQSLNISIEELYDDQQYFDRSPSVPVSEYYNLFDEATNKYFQTKGIVLSSSSDLLNSFSISTSADLDTLQATLSETILELTDSQLYGTFIQNYLSENKNIITVSAPPPIIDVTDVQLEAGDNFFYYPYGSIDTSLSLKKRITPVPLSSIQIDLATAGETLDASDTVFVKNGNSIKAAWYNYTEFEEQAKTVKTICRPNTTTSFIFPFPGYGLSSASVEWTGSDFETTRSYDFLSKETKTAINNAYWNQILPSDTVSSFWLNDSSLIDSGANSGISVESSDKIYKGSTERDSDLPKIGLSGAWLYEFKSCSIPIVPDNENVLIWPYDLIDPQEDLPAHIKEYSFLNSCDSVFIEELDSSHFTASNNFETADKIYKLQNISDEIELATECCWLSSQAVIEDDIKYSEQNGVSLLLESGKCNIFVWSGPTMYVDSAFGSVSHQPDCPFVTNVPAVSTTQWDKCLCKQVYYSPFGHPGGLFEDYNAHCDYICEIAPEDYNGSFDLGSWADSNGNSKKNSDNFAWFKTDKSDRNWGYGTWVDENSNKSFLTLSPGKLYCYYRATSKTESENFPPLVVLKKDKDDKKTKWIQAKKNENGEWSSAEFESQMYFDAGDILKIERNSSTVWHQVTSTLVENQSENRGSEWSSIDYIAIGSDLQTATISWPFDSSGTEQSPPVNYASLSAILWWKIESIETPSEYIELFSTYKDFQSQQLSLPDSEGGSDIALLSAVTVTDRTYINANNFSFTPKVTGFYAISVAAVDVNGVEHYLDSSTIPLLSVVPLYKEEPTEVERSFKNSGFLLEHPLSGWDYPGGISGGRPYWAKLYSDKGPATKQKGVRTWGYPNRFVEEYLPHNIPEISPLKIEYGDTIEYERTTGTLYWNQPIVYKTFVDKKEWKALESVQTVNSNLSSIFETQTQNSIEVTPTLCATDILLTNNSNGLPVEIYYHALNSFVWPISVITTEVNQEERISSPETYFSSQNPWSNLGNRFYPTIAVLPVLEQTYSQEQVGGYFTPNLLGASQFINKDFDAYFDIEELSGTFVTEDVQTHIGGRGRTKQDQSSLYKWEEQNQWVKESPISEKLAGSVNKGLTKTLQTFVPYQTNLPETALGLVTPSSRMSPWGGPEADVWTDSLNEPKSFTGVRNVPAWAEKQVLKQNQQWIDCWTSDIFGNQYGLFKQLDGVPVHERREIGGELWTRTNNQVVLPARESLSATFGLFSSNPSFYSELTGTGIKTADCFFNMLLLETSLSTVFIELDYDYEESKIITVFDNIIKEPNTAQRKFEKSWFFPERKQIVSLFTSLTGSSFYPELMELNLNDKTYKRIFPNYLTPAGKIISETTGIGSVQVQHLDRGCISYNNLLKSFLITYKGVDAFDKMFVIDFIIEEQKDPIVRNLTIYIDNSNENRIENPPAVPEYLFDTFVVPVSTSGFIQLTATNQPNKFEILNFNETVTVNNFGKLNYYFNTSGLYQVNYRVSNIIGESQYCLTLSAT